jgi:electron transfer flavoprotein-quinone oxidoreductase
MAKRVSAEHVAVGVKELIELPESVIMDRFGLQGNEGAACLFAGSPTDGLMGAASSIPIKLPFHWGWFAVFII